MNRTASIPFDPAELPDDVVSALCEGTCDDPFRWLGPHHENGIRIVRALIPGADALELCSGALSMPLQQIRTGLPIFCARIPDSIGSYSLRGRFNGEWHRFEDPYRFGSTVRAEDLAAFAAGTAIHLHHWMGALPFDLDGCSGFRFTVWAPNARRVSIIGDFNGWDGRRHVMRRHHDAGVWELFLPGVSEGDHYKYEILTQHGERLLKADPMGIWHQSAPGTASLLSTPPETVTARRPIRQDHSAPLSIYEVHAGSWRRKDGGGHLDYDALANELIPWVTELGFTHIEFLPLNEHPFEGSWGYQPTGLFAPTSRFGDWRAFKRLIDRCHEADIGVILDWVPGHFPNDAHGLVRFDGTALYEHDDPRLGAHPDWGTLIYNFDRHEVKSFLLSSAIAWLERFGIDGLRVDAVASMLYLDYSRREGEWLPNAHGGRENLGAVAFLKELNTAVYREFPDAITIAEESTAWPAVSRPVHHGGLGFGCKWNMGWMNDTLGYMAREPVHRSHHHREITFGLIYAFAENFILPLSHDEVVHGKRSLLGRMPGDRWQQFANLRALYGLMWAHPGKKLLFMGGEFAQQSEWNHDAGLEWHLLAHPQHRGVRNLVADLNRLYRNRTSLHELDHDPTGFQWLRADDADTSVFAFMRLDTERNPVLVIANLTPVVRHDWKVGVPVAGIWNEILNTDAALYGGSNVGNAGQVATADGNFDGRQYYLNLTLPPLATIWLQPSNAGTH